MKSEISKGLLLYDAQDGLCFWCSKTMIRVTHTPDVATHLRHLHVTVDHLVPLSRGGKRTPDNEVAACRRCNSTRGNTMPREFIQKKLEEFDGLLKSAAYRRFRS